MLGPGNRFAIDFGSDPDGRYSYGDQNPVHNVAYLYTSRLYTQAGTGKAELQRCVMSGLICGLVSRCPSLASTFGRPECRRIQAPAVSRRPREIRRCTWRRPHLRLREHHRLRATRAIDLGGARQTLGSPRRWQFCLRRGRVRRPRRDNDRARDRPVRSTWLPAESATPWRARCWPGTTDSGHWPRVLCTHSRGLLLYAARVPLHRAAWLGLLAGVTLACDLVLFLRHLLRRRSGAAAPSEEQREQWRLPTWRLPAWHAVAFGSAAVIAVCAVWLAGTEAANQHYRGFTQLWLVRRSQMPDCESWRRQSRRQDDSVPDWCSSATTGPPPPGISTCLTAGRGNMQRNSPIATSSVPNFIGCPMSPTFTDTSASAITGTAHD